MTGPQTKTVQPSNKTLLVGTQALVGFVESAREAEKSWLAIMEEWNREHPDRQAKSPRSLQANYYQARRRLKKKMIPQDSAGVEQQHAGEVENKPPRKMSSLRKANIPSAKPREQDGAKEADHDQQ